LTIYLDACCLSRLTDDQTQRRIREEAEVIEQILVQAQAGVWAMISSAALVEEVGRIRSPERRIAVEALLSLATKSVELSAGVRARAREFAAGGYGSFDALHLAAAEAASADVLLSTDDRFVSLARRGIAGPRIAVRNPLSLVGGAWRMIALDQLTDEQFERHALDLLKRELGAGGLARFLRLYRSGTGDYTRDRYGGQDHLSVDEILASIDSHREE